MLKSNDASWINTCVDTTFVKIYVDVKCKWEGIAPDYRIYVNDELFSERTYSWEDPVYLTEILQINGQVDQPHRVHLETVGPQLAEFTLVEPRVAYCDKNVQIFPADKPKEFMFRVTQWK